MNAHTDLSFSRRAMLKATGGFVVAFSMTEAGKVLAQGLPPSGKPPLIPTELDSWIAVDPKGMITVYFGKVDLGQGTDRAMTMIVADEMDVALKDVSIVQGDTAWTVNQGGASGSTGVRFAGAALRQAGAEAKRVLVNRAAEKLGVAPEMIAVTAGVASVKGDPSKKVSYAEL